MKKLALEIPTLRLFRKLYGLGFTVYGDFHFFLSTVIRSGVPSFYRYTLLCILPFYKLSLKHSLRQKSNLKYGHFH